MPKSAGASPGIAMHVQKSAWGVQRSNVIFFDSLKLGVSSR